MLGLDDKNKSLAVAKDPTQGSGLCLCISKLMIPFCSDTTLRQGCEVLVKAICTSGHEPMFNASSLSFMV
jgi:hypothetical protein